ncbi:MAG: hypothetical protein GY832_28140 [Chloroflexi bacterium]|nr:hypothetical protein [Chloroflexota bacterium]
MEALNSIDITVLYTEGCAATPATIELIRQVAEKKGVPFRLQKILVASPDQALQLEFLGSPTVQVNGLDIEPSARSSTAYGFT